MRLLMFHVEDFSCTVTQKGRSPYVEPASEKVSRLQDGLLVLASVEAEDEGSPEQVSRSGAREVIKVAKQLGVTRAMVHPFAHLFGRPARPEVAVLVLDSLRQGLADLGLDATRTPFGWFNSWEMKARGHPLSRVARHIRADVADS